MQTLIKIEGEWIEGEPTEGEAVKYVYPDGHSVEVIYTAPVITPIIELTNVVIPETTLVGNIHWLKVNTPFTMTANVALPDGDYMIMVQQVVDIDNPMDDVRFIGTVLNGQMTLIGMFPKMGNYVVTAERMNKGLDYIGAPIHLSFDKIEFDIHY